MKILILGGTSFFGKEAAKLFHKEGFKVTLFTRGNQRPTDLPPVQQIRGDRNLPGHLKQLAEQGPWDLLLDNIAYDGMAVRNVLSSLKGKVRRYMLTSTVSVYRYTLNQYPQPLEESVVDYDYRPPEEDLNDVHWKYRRGKLEAEKQLIQQAEIPWTVFRPTIVYGPEDPLKRGFWYLARLIDGRPISLANGGVASFRLAYSKDVARCFLLAAQTDCSIAKIYNIAGQECITLRDFIDESAKCLGCKASLVNVPGDQLTEEQAGPYGKVVNLIPDISAAKRDLSFKPTPFQTMIRDTAKWFSAL
ncbi:MAG: NAD-dependent epimerase/dehydratase family protein [Deltaproteobacteria bacterium]|nr:NAD-dependent epimerase/dehydratase family protein [Deltaproteobacteria bacterium]